MNQRPTAELQKRREWVRLGHMHDTHKYTHTAAWRSCSLLSEAAEADGCLSVLLMRPDEREEDDETGGGQDGEKKAQLQEYSSGWKIFQYWAHWET